jgi:hypothetical protein
MFELELTAAIELLGRAKLAGDPSAVWRGGSLQSWATARELIHSMCPAKLQASTADVDGGRTVRSGGAA